MVAGGRVLSKSTAGRRGRDETAVEQDARIQHARSRQAAESEAVQRCFGHWLIPPRAVFGRVSKNQGGPNPRLLLSDSMSARVAPFADHHACPL